MPTLLNTTVKANVRSFAAFSPERPALSVLESTYINNRFSTSIGKAGRESDRVRADVQDLMYVIAPIIAQELLRSLVAQPVEEGVRHPAEQVVERAIKQYDVTFIQHIMEQVYISEEKTRSWVAMETLRILGRLPFNQIDPWGFDLVELALRHENANVRDAAVAALEEWGRDKSLALLRAHAKNEPVHWLRDYINDVIAYLSK